MKKAASRRQNRQTSGRLDGRGRPSKARNNANVARPIDLTRDELFEVMLAVQCILIEAEKDFEDESFSSNDAEGPFHRLQERNASKTVPSDGLESSQVDFQGVMSFFRSTLTAESCSQKRETK